MTMERAHLGCAYASGVWSNNKGSRSFLSLGLTWSECDVSTKYEPSLK